MGWMSISDSWYQSVRESATYSLAEPGILSVDRSTDRAVRAQATSPPASEQVSLLGGNSPRSKPVNRSVNHQSEVNQSTDPTDEANQASEPPSSNHRVLPEVLREDRRRPDRATSTP